VHIDGTPEEQLLLFTIVPLVFRTFAPIRLFISTFGARHVLSSKTTRRCHREDRASACTQMKHHHKIPPITHRSTSLQTKSSPPLTKVQNTLPADISPKCNSTNQLTHPPAQQGQAKLVEGLRVNHPCEHLHQYTCFQET
jgi:hypothetical protein